MKKIIAIIMAVLLIVCMAVPASAITTGRWDFQAGLRHAQATAAQMMEEQQTTEPTEPVEVEEPIREQSWRDWLRSWSWCWEGWK